MWGVGISFLMIGSVPLLVKKLNGNLDSSVLPFYKATKLSGYAVLLLSFVCLFLEEPLKGVLPVLPVLVFGLWCLSWIKKMKLGLDEV